jgi:lipopolysaccharide/colanic/teichoic acid biosynthesis glycosyltransferase
MDTQFSSEAAVLPSVAGPMYDNAVLGASSPVLASPHGEAVYVDFLPRERDERLNRVFNIIVAGVALLVLSPLLIVVALAVRFTSPGPVFYRQSRIGHDRRRPRPGDAAPVYDRRACNLGGRPFSILKFRTMTVNAEGRCGVVWAQKHDPRVTALGRLLRKTRLDEVPQLLNVLRDDMNIVGPRPERPSIFARLRRDIREYALRQRAKPGITGLAQINHSYDASVDDVRVKVRYDLEYLRRQSLIEDMRIMLLTLPVIVFRKGGW